MNRTHDGEVRRYLESDERLLWSGSPRQGFVLRGADVFLIPFSLLWGGFAFYWEASVVTHGAPVFFELWGIPFVLVGVYIVVGRFFVDARIRANTFYGLTDRRIIILAGLFTRSVTTLPLRTLQDISLKERSDRSGTILLGRPAAFGGWYQGLHWPGSGRYQVPSFDMIPDVKRVHDQLLGAQRAAT